eukprot:sb/3466013/
MGRGSGTESSQQNFSEFAAVVYRRLKVYRGIYIFYSITSFMLGLPVTVTGFKKQFFPLDETEDVDVLYCPHYLGIVSLLSCFISLWTALKNQIILCVLTLLSGLITVIAAMIVLVTTALQLTNLAQLNTMEKHTNQQTHVIFIFSIGLLIGSLAIVITTLSHLSGRRGKRSIRNKLTDSVPSSGNLCLGGFVPGGEGGGRGEYTLPDTKVASCKSDMESLKVKVSNAHRNSFATTISNLVRHELRASVRGPSPRETRPERVKKTQSCPNERRQKAGSMDFLHVKPVTRSSTRSLPATGAISVPEIDIEGASTEEDSISSTKCTMDHIIECVRAEGEEVLSKSPPESVVAIIDCHAKESVV